MYDTSVFLNLQNFKRDSYISVICQASIYAGEGRKADAVAHLAVARSQKTENGISGSTNDEKAVAKATVLLFHTDNDFILTITVRSMGTDALGWEAESRIRKK